MAGEILIVSSERIAQELKKMLVHVRRAAAMRLADDLKLLAVILPELVPVLVEPGVGRWLRTLAMLERLEQPDFELALATLLALALADAIADPASICRRLKLSNKEQEHVCWLLQHREAIDGAPQMRLSQLKRLLAEPGVGDLLALARVAAECGLGSLTAIEFCERYLAETPAGQIDPPALVTGQDLIRAGLSPGVRFKELLELVRDAQLEGAIGTPDEALALIKKAIGRPG
jgi:poly(A) polymerase